MKDLYVFVLSGLVCAFWACFGLYHLRSPWWSRKWRAAIWAYVLCCAAAAGWNGAMIVRLSSS